MAIAMAADARAIIGGDTDSGFTSSALGPRSDPWSSLALTRPSRKSGVPPETNNQTETTEQETRATTLISRRTATMSKPTSPPELTTRLPAPRVTSGTKSDVLADNTPSPTTLSPHEPLFAMEMPPSQQQQQRPDKKQAAPSSSRANAPESRPTRSPSSRVVQNLDCSLSIATGSPQYREKTHSPQLFFSDDDDDDDDDDAHDDTDYFRPGILGRRGLRNSGKILDRTRGKRVS
ncbi:hypothetical protein ACJQWK_09056 [Exserohilum turcicum]|uniref:Uncharacterized protein n=1 Tax=Exserohilum turcicum (strain 28A) TaxID=671987 RepID=R0KCN7_EXST2|nr:uncharacterized protein SETTUDRAFT_178975 [Exserohilum turcica Et28A]EOA87119.1 hypothetical protein SETTUDRAFT_178975 [Exserohilum turcica Et28A]